MLTVVIREEDFNKNGQVRNQIPKFQKSKSDLFLERIIETIYSGTDTEFCIPDHWVQAAVMVKIRTFKLNPDLFRTTF